MSLPGERFSLSVADYLVGERDGTVRREYVNGYAYAMTGERPGASERHNRIAGNIFVRFDETPEA
ncbi:MAG TPA: hypothetical protein VGC87_02755 [Pyrinomonadaceae bacterium]|jgi:hypothetical protein